MKKLLIVESPNKVAKINSILGNEWEIISTSGHIEMLASEKFCGIRGIGIDIPSGFIPRYIIRPDRQAAVDRIRESAKNAKEIYIGTDPDREGEAIAYSVSKILGSGASQQARRVLFDSITRDAIKDGIANYRKIDLYMVRAAHARQVIDKLIGMVLSAKANDALHANELSHHQAHAAAIPNVKYYFSVGRVQSPVLSMVIERDKDISNFKSETSYKVVSSYDVFGSVGAESMRMKASCERKFQSLAQASKFAEKLKKHPHRIASVKKTMLKIPPSYPLVTSSMQMEANSRFGMSAAQAMRSAQSLFERGLITYPRTDSPHISDEAFIMAEKWITERYGQEYFERRHYEPNTLYAQEAHECLRPASFDSIDVKWLSRDWKQIHGIAAERFLQSCMPDAVLEETVYTIEAIGENGIETFEAKGMKVIFDGFYRMAGIPTFHEIPELKEGSVLPRYDMKIAKSRTLPPDPYNEASLVGLMAENGLGRPSTYASIIETIKDRGYVGYRDEDITTLDRRNGRRRGNGGFTAMERGVQLVEYLRANHSWVLDKNFTKELEDDLDRVAYGDKEYIDPVKKAWNKLTETVPELNILTTLRPQ